MCDLFVIQCVMLYGLRVLHILPVSGCVFCGCLCVRVSVVVVFVFM